jgi:hypothetical protein
MTAFTALAWVLASTAIADTAADADADTASIDLNILSPSSL